MRNVLVTGENLFRIAAVQLSDATPRIRIAQLNNLTDPMLVGLTKLLIPDADRNAGGGIADQ
jgi:hypothetical protein